MTDGQRVAVLILLGCRGRVTDEAAHVLSALVGGPVVLDEMTAADWGRLRELAWPGWRENDWTVGEECLALMVAARRDYVESVLGQGRLFA